ncbi:MAG: bifunctional folylpolyglutamate synthase/dihydrofolate synthase [Oscillospiraceae bacterium]|nr:bifunctional folylpolyglutamate synthase/dihydrofolate synthase [Oscillospiraceae bacterium]
MNAREAIEYIHSVSWKGSVPGLSRTEELLRRIGNPEKQLRFIHIAGTNGKGSTAATLASIFRAAGYRTGLYTSPYLIRFNERIQMDGECITDRELAEITEFIKPHAEAMEDTPTEFELVTTIGFEFLRRKRAEIVILEVGMGGELDSTNVIPAPEAAVICNIGLDHTEYLGATLAEIAKTKAGIIKSGCVCVLYPNEKSVENAVAAKCRAVGAELRIADFSLLSPVSHSLDGQEFSFSGKRYKTPLLGEHQLKNAAVALTAVDALCEKGWNIPQAAITRGMAQTVWPGRFQILRREPLMIIDGGHNPQCMDAMVKNVDDYLQGYDLTILTGVLADKDYKAMYRELAKRASRFLTVTPPSPRALDGAELARYLQTLGKSAEHYTAIDDAVAAALSIARQTGGAVLACGSLYMLGDVIRAEEKRH